ncbi:DUF6597 domain-containing transcriptional factor [Spirosoma litoris]
MQVNPSPQLAHLVKHYLILENTSSAEHTYRFFPDGNPGLVFSYADPFTEGRDFAAASNQYHNFFYGQANQYHDLKAGKTISLLVVVLQPWGLHALSGLPGIETRNMRLSLDNLLAPVAVDVQQAKQRDCSGPLERIRQIEEFLSKLSPPALTPETRFVQQAVQQIYQTNGMLSIQQILQGLGTTERSLERRFEQVIGLRPKQFSRIIRLQNSLKIHRQKPTLNLTELTYCAGYYDQAHFIREFNQLVGLTPKQYEANPNRLAVNLMPIYT